MRTLEKGKLAYFYANKLTTLIEWVALLICLGIFISKLGLFFCLGKTCNFMKAKLEIRFTSFYTLLDSDILSLRSIFTIFNEPFSQYLKICARNNLPSFLLKFFSVP